MTSDGFHKKGRTPAAMPCCQVFEPGVQSGHRLASSGFSVQAELAHRSQGRFPS